MSRVTCECGRIIEDRETVLEVLRNFGNCRCKECRGQFQIFVAPADVKALPEPYQTEAMSVFSGCD